MEDKAKAADATIGCGIFWDREKNQLQLILAFEAGHMGVPFVKTIPGITSIEQVKEISGKFFSGEMEINLDECNREES